MSSCGGRIKDLNAQNLLENTMIITLVFNVLNSTSRPNLFCKSKEHFLNAMYSMEHEMVFCPGLVVCPKWNSEYNQNPDWIKPAGNIGIKKLWP